LRFASEENSPRDTKKTSKKQQTGCNKSAQKENNNTKN